MLLNYLKKGCEKFMNNSGQKVFYYSLHLSGEFILHSKF